MFQYEIGDSTKPHHDMLFKLLTENSLENLPAYINSVKSLLIEEPLHYKIDDIEAESRMIDLDSSQDQSLEGILEEMYGQPSFPQEPSCAQPTLTQPSLTQQSLTQMDLSEPSCAQSSVIHTQTLTQQVSELSLNKATRRELFT